LKYSELINQCSQPPEFLVVEANQQQNQSKNKE
jgi:hypothetical protein